MMTIADSFPNICKLHNLGTLNSGREILIVQISDNVGVKENEPSFLYTSSIWRRTIWIRFKFKIN